MAVLLPLLIMGWPFWSVLVGTGTSGIAKRNACSAVLNIMVEIYWAVFIAFLLLQNKIFLKVEIVYSFVITVDDLSPFWCFWYVMYTIGCMQVELV